jgi:uncharacterized membrane protein YphA (DoxX/SURF4 family)
MIDPVLEVVIRGAFALLFAMAGLEKFHDRTTFQFQLQEYQLLPQKIIPLAAPIIIFIEITIAVALLLPNSVYGVILGSALLMVYAAAILINLIRGRTCMDCGCLGSSGEGLSYWLVVRNLTLTLSLLVILLPPISRALIWMDYMSIAFSIVAASVAYVVLNTLLAANTRSKMWWS